MKKFSMFAAGLLTTLIASTAAAHSLNPAFVEKVTGQSVDMQEETQPTEPVNLRNEQRTFATFPEWYIVYSAQEYADFVAAGGRPSQFPYFDATAQYWESVGHVTKALGDEKVDSETDTVIKVIGASFTVENALIGAYEGTVGRLFELLNFFQKTKEDTYTDAVAKEYGDSMLTTPWYDFPYWSKLAGLWTTYGWSSITPRGLERRAAFTAGYTIKGIYGFIIRKLTQTSLTLAELETSFVVRGMTQNAVASIPTVTVLERLPNGDIRAKGERYRAFLDVARAVAATRGSFVSIQENDRIMLTVFARGDETCLNDKTRVFTLPVLTKQGTNRIALSVPVTDLARTLNTLDACGVAVEHLYDY